MTSVMLVWTVSSASLAARSSAFSGSHQDGGRRSVHAVRAKLCDMFASRVDVELGRSVSVETSQTSQSCCFHLFVSYPWSKRRSHLSTAEHPRSDLAVQHIWPARHCGAF